MCVVRAFHLERPIYDPTRPDLRLLYTCADDEHCTVRAAVVFRAARAGCYSFVGGGEIAFSLSHYRRDRSPLASQSRLYAIVFTLSHSRQWVN